MVEQRSSGRVAVMVLLALIGLPLMADAHGGDPSLVHACVGLTKYVRLVDPNGNCRSTETARHWSIAGPQGPKGDPGGAFVVVDSLGNVVGPLVSPDRVVITVNATRLLMLVRRDGVFGNGFVLYYPTTDCTGQAYAENGSTGPPFGLFGQVETLCRPSDCTLREDYYVVPGSQTQTILVQSTLTQLPVLEKCQRPSPFSATVVPALPMDLSAIQPPLSIQ